MVPDIVGVVIIGRNEGERLINCLTSVKSDVRNIVYVDSGSTDGSVPAARELGAFVVNLDLTLPFTAARARNLGFTTLKKLNPEVRFVQFVDGDCVLVEGWLNKSFVFMQDRKDTAVVCGRRRELHPTASVYNNMCDLEWDSPVGDALLCGGDALVRAEAFEAIGGFREKLIAGEEPELCLRLRDIGWKIWRLDAEMTRHDAAITRFGQWWTRSVRCGYAYAEVSRLHRTSPARIWRRETARAFIWGGALPTTICLGAMVNTAATLGVIVYVFQICRIAFDRGPRSSTSWAYGFFMTIGKFAEFQGILRLYWRQWFGKKSTLIEYK
jgi:GT2 family glycosyltransferase